MKTDWNRSHGESNIGNFIADAQREAAEADVGFMNSGGIRKDFSAGPITRQDLFEIMPFCDTIVKFELTGKQIRSIVEIYITEHTSIQTSGIKCEWKKRADRGIEFATFFVNGKPLDENKTYICAASDYFVDEATSTFKLRYRKLHLSIKQFSQPLRRRFAIQKKFHPQLNIELKI